MRSAELIRDPGEAVFNIQLQLHLGGSFHSKEERVCIPGKFSGSLLEVAAPPVVLSCGLPLRRRVRNAGQLNAHMQKKMLSKSSPVLSVIATFDSVIVSFVLACIQYHNWLLFM